MFVNTFNHSHEYIKFSLALNLAMFTNIVVKCNRYICMYCGVNAF
jgi:hypothetical protein